MGCPEPSRRVLEYMVGMLSSIEGGRAKTVANPGNGTIERSVLDAVREVGPVSARRLADEVGVDLARVRNALYRLKDRELVDISGTETVARSKKVVVVRVLWVVRKHPV